MRRCNTHSWRDRVFQLLEVSLNFKVSFVMLAETRKGTIVSEKKELLFHCRKPNPKGQFTLITKQGEKKQKELIVLPSPLLGNERRMKLSKNWCFDDQECIIKFIWHPSHCRVTLGSLKLRNARECLYMMLDNGENILLLCFSLS